MASALTEDNKNSKILKTLRKMLPGTRAASDQAGLQGIPVGGSGYSGAFQAGTPAGSGEEPQLTTSGDEIGINAHLPLERMSCYAELEKMASSPTIGAMLAIHGCNALAPDRTTGKSFSIVPKNPGDKDAQKLCAELMADLGDKLNHGLPGWALLMMIFGVSYVRPHCQAGRGIVEFESSFYTLPHFVREFEQGGELAGFAGDYLLHPVTKQRIVAMPWELIPLRSPFFVPSRSVMPLNVGYQSYSLLTPPQQAPLMETQNYGTSFLASCYEPWLNLQDALRSLKATRNNAAKIDRLIAVAMGQTDPANGARYINNLGQHMKRNQDAISSMAYNNNAMPVVMNHFIPVNGDGGKGGITIDTQQTPADISGLEDVMFHLRQLCAAGGIDATMLGWADQMAGGLGDGGWLQTSIQAAQRAEWIRLAAENFILRAIDIHLAWKSNTVIAPDARPYRIEFNSLNSAVAERELAEQDSRANFVSQIVGVLDQILGNEKLAKSDTLMTYLFSSQLCLSAATLEKLLDELQNGGNQPATAILESAPIQTHANPGKCPHRAAYAQFAATR